ncbi:Fc.00g007190.m01.CDS01 [Cosmosporella sp. VM-42]
MGPSQPKPVYALRGLPHSYASAQGTRVSSHDGDLPQIERSPRRKIQRPKLWGPILAFRILSFIGAVISVIMVANARGDEDTYYKVVKLAALRFDIPIVTLVIIWNIVYLSLTRCGCVARFHWGWLLAAEVILLALEIAFANLLGTHALGTEDYETDYAIGCWSILILLA